MPTTTVQTSTPPPTSQTMHAYSALGYGSSGVVVASYNHALKLYNAPADEASILREGSLQAAACRDICNILRVPAVHTVTRRPYEFENCDYIAGIYMDPVPGHVEIDGLQLHVPLGLDLDDDQYMPSGFFPTVDTLERHLSFKHSRHSIESLAATMGSAHRRLLDTGIIPKRVKFVLGADDELWMIGFRHCTSGYIEPRRWLVDHQREIDPYAPHEGQRGYVEYMNAFLYDNM